MAKIRHFIWTDYEDDGTKISGRVAARIEDGEIWFSHINGKAPYAKIHAWKEALEVAFPEVFEGDRWEREHLQRPWCIEARGGVGGCVTYKLRELVDEDLLNAPVRGSIGISASRRLKDFRMRIGHFKAILKHILTDTLDNRGDLRIVAVEPENRGWNPPYEKGD